MAAAAGVTGHLTDVRKLISTFPTSASTKTTHPEIENESIAHKQEDAHADEKADIVTDAPANSSVHAAVAPGESAGMPKFTVLKGYAAPLDIANADTDMIIPKQFLKTIKRTGLRDALFYALRFNPETGAENPNFVLNQEPYRQARILVCTGPNFGCGSSREHAPWALNDFGIRCIIGTSYADIFFNNCFKNGMLPIVLDQESVNALADDGRAGKEIEVDLVNQVVLRPDGTSIPFDVEAFRKHCLVNGLDDIGLTMQKNDMIESFEEKRTSLWPWLNGKGYNGQATRIVPVASDSAPKKKLDW
jgi:3-isopropylmalate dehydratase